jgi:hypothetical protein
VGSMFRGCHAPCTMKIFFVDFRKEYHAHCSRYKRLHCSSLSLHNCPVAVNSRYQGWPTLSWIKLKYCSLDVKQYRECIFQMI